ncbi:MAG: ADOP family duplicated permease [Vicinamibacterales bacterium]|nr:ADOP family duplicated permease [Vicinamibacterales bacterium]
MHALRQLRRQPGLTLTALVTLGLGLGAALAVFTLVHAVLLRPLPYPAPDRVAALGRAYASGLGRLAWRDVDFLRAHVRTCAPIGVAFDGAGRNVVLDGSVLHATSRHVSREYFASLGIAPRWGRPFSAQEDAATPAPVAIFTEALVRRHGLAPEAVVGRDALVGGVPHTVVGILDAGVTLASDPEVFVPLGRHQSGGGLNLTATCRLAEAATTAALAAELDGLTAQALAEGLIQPQETRAYATTPQHEALVGSVRTRILTLAGAVVLVLLVAASNTTGLLLVRAAGRRREMALRAALGAAPHRLARGLLVEGLVLGVLSGALGLAVAPLFVNGLLAMAPPSYHRLGQFHLDATLAAAGLVLCALVGLAVSVPPLAELLRVNLRDTLQDEGARSTGGRQAGWLRHLLIGAETALCAVLLVGALLLTRTFVNLVTEPPGFDPAGVVTARMAVQGPAYADPARLQQFFEDGLARLAAEPGVEAAAVGASLPAEITLNLPVRFPDAAEPDRLDSHNWRYVTPEYFAVLRMPLVEGRTFEARDRRGAPAVALVNESFARQVFGGLPEALGQRIVTHPIRADVDEPVREVVGVVADTAGFAVGDAPRPTMFVPLAQVDGALLHLVNGYVPPRWIVRGAAGNTESARRALVSSVRALDPDQPLASVQTLDALMIDSIGTQRFYLVVLLSFAVFAMVLAAVGIYAAYAYAVASRQAEFGVRLALGASPRRLLAGILRQGLLVGGVSIAVGLGLALAVSRVLASVLHGVAPTDPLTYAAVAIVLLVTVAGATLGPAIRASRVDPLLAMKH